MSVGVRPAPELDPLLAQALIGALPLAVYTATLDANPSPVYIAPQVEELLGVTAAEFDFSLLRENLHPDDQARVTRAFERADAQQADLKLEYRYVRPDGRTIWIEDSSRVVEIGGHALAQGYLLDVTERKRFEENLSRRTEVRHRLAGIGRRSLEGAPRDRIVIEALGLLRDGLDADVGAFLELVDGELTVTASFGWEAQGAIAFEGTPAHGVLQTRETFVGDTAPTNPNSLLARLGMRSTIASPVLCDGWDCFGVVAVHSRAVDAFQHDDVSLADQVANLIGAVVARERYDIRARASQRLEAVGQLSAGVAHDFNNMLTVISGYAAFARTRADAEGERQLDHVLRAADRARALTSQLLAFSRQQVLQRRPVALSEIVAAVAPMLSTTLGENVAVIEGGDDAIVMADPLQIENVLVNLAVNARDAMPDGGTLTIERSNVEIDSIVAHRNEVAPGGYGMLTVSDTGFGMPENVLARVFEPFFTTKAPGSGTGLGLAGVYGTIRQSGGFVAVESAPGAGSSFTVYLPLSDVPLTAEEEEEPEDEPVTVAVRILLVEDEDIVQRVLEKQIAALGHEVTSVDRASEALDLLETEEFDVLLSDVGLPGIDGASLAATVRELHPQLGVILMSGYPGDHIASNPALAGVPLLQKPFQPRELQAVVADLLD